MAESESPRPQQGGMNVNPYDSLLRRPWRESIGLDEGQWVNLTNVVGMHMVLDHLLALRILVAQWATGQVEQGSVENQMSILADTSFGRRIELAKESGLLSGEEVADLTEINRIRNSLLHYKPKLKEGFKSLPPGSAPL